MEESNAASPAPILASLDAETARRFITDPHLVNVGEFSKLDTDAAAILAEREGHLFLDGLTELSIEAAEALAGHRGALVLNGLKRVSAEVAAALWKKGVVQIPSRFNRWEH